MPGVNDHALGEIVRFARDHVPAVRGVHFQPVQYWLALTIVYSGIDDRVCMSVEHYIDARGGCNEVCRGISVLWFLSLA